MRLVYKATGKEVQVMDEVTLRDGVYRVIGWAEPHKPESTGRVYVQDADAPRDSTQEMSYFPDVIGAEWIEREDRGWVDPNKTVDVIAGFDRTIVVQQDEADISDRPEAQEVMDIADKRVGRRLADHPTSRYGFKVGDYVITVIEMSDEIGMMVEKGTILRIEAISPKVRICKGDSRYHDTKQYFLNSCRLGDKYPRLRHDFVTVRILTKQELRTAVRHMESIVMSLRPRA